MAEDDYSLVYQCEMLKMYGVFIRYHPVDDRYDWVDDFFEVAEGKALFVAARNGRMFVGWGKIESTIHDHVYRDSVNIVNGEIFFVSMDNGRNYLNLGDKSVAIGGTACNIEIETEQENLRISWVICGLSDQTRQTWVVETHPSIISAYPR